jgi:very-short-patch-repair endonuclease
MTDAELRIWLGVRGEQLDGHRFRRQVPIGPYIVDFVCLKAKLVIEIDGGQHQVNAEGDAARSAWLESRGYRVLRFWNTDVLREGESVLEKIRRELITPSPTLPARGREKPRS